MDEPYAAAPGINPHALQRAELRRPLPAMGQGDEGGAGRSPLWDCRERRLLRRAVSRGPGPVASTTRRCAARVGKVRVRRQRRSDDAGRVRDVRARPRNVRASGTARTSTRRTTKSRSALGIKSTIPNASGVLFKRPVDMPLLDDESWLSMSVAGDWNLRILHLCFRGGRIAYDPAATNFFRRYAGSAAALTYKKENFYREVGIASRAVAALYDVPMAVLERCRENYRGTYQYHGGRSDEEFSRWYNYQAVLSARDKRLPNVLVSTMGFFPVVGFPPIRLANEFKRQGLSVLLLTPPSIRGKTAFAECCATTCRWSRRPASKRS